MFWQGSAQRHKAGDGEQQNFLLCSKKRDPQAVIESSHFHLSEISTFRTVWTPHDRSHNLNHTRSILFWWKKLKEKRSVKLYVILKYRLMKFSLRCFFRSSVSHFAVKMWGCNNAVFLIETRPNSCIIYMLIMGREGCSVWLSSAFFADFAGLHAMATLWVVWR